MIKIDKQKPKTAGNRRKFSKEAYKNTARKRLMLKGDRIYSPFMISAAKTPYHVSKILKRKGNLFDI